MNRRSVLGTRETFQIRTERRREWQSFPSDGNGTRRRERFRPLKRKNFDAFDRDV
jgi:hypothetical protein